MSLILVEARTGMAPGHQGQPNILPDIFLLILLSDRHISAIGFQFMLKDPAESIVLHAEGMVQHWCDVILSVDTGKSWLGLCQGALEGCRGLCWTAGRPSSASVPDFVIPIHWGHHSFIL